MAVKKLYFKRPGMTNSNTNWMLQQQIQKYLYPCNIKLLFNRFYKSRDFIDAKSLLLHQKKSKHEIGHTTTNILLPFIDNLDINHLARLFIILSSIKINYSQMPRKTSVLDIYGHNLTNNRTVLITLPPSPSSSSFHLPTHKGRGKFSFPFSFCLFFHSTLTYSFIHKKKTFLFLN